MSAVDELRQTMLSSIDKANRADKAATTLRHGITEMHHLVEKAAAGSNQDTVQDVIACLNRATDRIDDLRHLIASGTDSVDLYAGIL